MGKSGCEAAKEVADIIILDDNFNSVFRATQWGRNILDNIRKFIQFQLTVNCVCMTMVLLGGATLGFSPFSVTQLLWTNMVMDTLAALSLATEPPHPTNLKAEKQKKGDKIILPVMWRNILSQFAYQALILIIMLYSVPYWFGKTYPYYDTDFYYTNSSTASDEYNTLKSTEADNKLFHFTMVFQHFHTHESLQPVQLQKDWMERRQHL